MDLDIAWGFMFELIQVNFRWLDHFLKAESNYVD